MNVHKFLVTVETDRASGFTTEELQAEIENAVADIIRAGIVDGRCVEVELVCSSVEGELHVS